VAVVGRIWIATLFIVPEASGAVLTILNVTK
jgi:hypothetical protein